MLSVLSHKYVAFLYILGAVNQSVHLCLIISCSLSLHADGQLFIHQRIRHLVRAFTERAQRIRRRIELPPTPSTISSDPGQNWSQDKESLLLFTKFLSFPFKSRVSEYVCNLEICMIDR